jgi:serine protease AprX
MPPYFIQARSRKSFDILRSRFELESLRLSKILPYTIYGRLPGEVAESLHKEDPEVIHSSSLYQVIPRELLLRSFRSAPVIHSILDVLGHIKVCGVSETGAGVHLAVIDSGICDWPKHFKNKSLHSMATSGTAWDDSSGHGTMIAGIAAAAEPMGGGLRGVAPGATLISCKVLDAELATYDTSLSAIYEKLIDLKTKHGVSPLVINNSYALSTKAAGLKIAASHPFLQLVREAVGNGIVVVFAAGNNHVQNSGHNAKNCFDNTIWGANSLDEVICVGTVDSNNLNNEKATPPADPGDLAHWDSSRGKGLLAKTTQKPDCVAPTYGTVFWGCSYDDKPCWHTSGAAAEVSGLAALLLEKNVKLTPEEVRKAIVDSCDPGAGLSKTCQGAGVINCEAALKLV